MRFARQRHFKQSEDFASLGHRREHRPLPFPHPAGVGLARGKQPYLLVAECLLDRTAVEGQQHRGFLDVSPIADGGL